VCCGVLQCVAVTLGSKNRIWACTHFPKNNALNAEHAKFYESNAGFCELQMTKKKNQSRVIQRVGLAPPQNCHFAPSFMFSKKYFSKKFKKNALDIIGVLFKDESITIHIVAQLNFFLDFAKTKVLTN